jgi:hypothetical protein
MRACEVMAGAPVVRQGQEDYVCQVLATPSNLSASRTSCPCFHANLEACGQRLQVVGYLQRFEDCQEPTSAAQASGSEIEAADKTPEATVLGNSLD